MDVTEEELRENMKKEILQYFGQMKMDGDTSWIESYVDRMMKDEKQVDSQLPEDLLLINYLHGLQSQVKPEEKEVSAEELNRVCSTIISIN
ncbi:MAG: hypothetical protein WKF59_04980 [Chitinophagaceae bacterium]